ncbi:uncharacterized protein LOC126790187 isoform X2 [Argentina anserina]|uniref:uncharacterized protein LOC126790187 isoform X2 n=1 Tax=Argentina anserina TaxID=57926 RepID=UPI002176300F|nr:uncharacterized protein LOC126790187 isoform X2 [Potentilla anserina]
MMNSLDCLDWANLHGTLVSLLLDKLLESIDHVRFAAVCEEWRAISKEYNKAKQRWCQKRLLPMLVISSTESEEKLELYSIPEKKVYKNIELPLPLRKSRRCFGSNHDSGGWLTIVDLVEGELPSLDITLMNPFREEMPPIHLPLLQSRIRSAKDHQISKVILCGDPTLNPDCFVVLAITRHERIGKRVYAIKGLNSDWVYWQFASEISDAIVYNSQIYSVTYERWLQLLDVDKAITKQFFSGSDTISSTRQGLSCKSTQGDLLLVQRFMEPKKDVKNDLHQILWTSSFLIHKVVFIDRDKKLDRSTPILEDGSPYYTGDGDRSEWVSLLEVENIGDEVLFVGDNYSFSVLASDYPGCQPNSIYYTDDSMKCGVHKLNERIPYDMGIFNLADKSIRPLCSSLNYSKRNVRPPFWTTTLFNGLC